MLSLQEESEFEISVDHEWSEDIRQWETVL
jgi:hypothetical protein